MSTVWKTPLSLIPDQYRPKQIQDASGNLKNWEEIYEKNPTYEVYTDINGKPISINRELVQDQLERADQRMIDKRNADEHVAENYGGKAWGKVGGTMLGAAALAGLAPAEVVGAANLGLTYLGLNNFLGANGYQKTANLWNTGQYGRAVLSGMGDALDISPVPFNLYRAYNLTKVGRVNRLARAMDSGIRAKKLPEPVVEIGVPLQKGFLSKEALTNQTASRAWNQAATAVQNKPFIEAYNRWNRFGYPSIPKKLETDTPRLEAFVKGQLNRHNTFSRGVEVLAKDKQELEASLGRKLTDDEFLRIAATTPRNNGEGQAALWISPYTQYTSIYGGGKTALVRRPFKLGSDRMKWFNEASFNVQHNPEGGQYTDIMAPWNNPKYSPNTSIPETELVSPTKMNFIDFVKGSEHMNNRTSLNSNPFFTREGNYFDPESRQWIINNYKKGGSLKK